MYYTGYYKDDPNFLEKNFDEFGILEYSIDNDLNFFDKIRLFLHGMCELFARALSEKYDYNVYKFFYENKLHYYCIYYFKNIKFYIDVRGITNDRNLFFREFSIEIDSIETNKLDNFDDKVENISTLVEFDEYVTNLGLEYARKIIEKYEIYYNINYIIKK